MPMIFQEKIAALDKRRVEENHVRIFVRIRILISNCIQQLLLNMLL